jgi:hypothetical protein
VARLLRWLRQPKVFSFLPIGLMLIALDVPFLRKPVARVMIWLERKWVALRQGGGVKRRRQKGNTT